MKLYVYFSQNYSLSTSRHISYTVRSRDGWRGVFLFFLKLFSTLIPTKRLLSLSLPHPQYLAIITSEITPLMEQNYPSGPCPKNIQCSQRAWILFEAESNIWKVGKWMKLKVLRETLTSGAAGVDLPFQIINIKSLKRVGIWDNCMHQKTMLRKKMRSFLDYIRFKYIPCDVLVKEVRASHSWIPKKNSEVSTTILMLIF